LEWRLSNSSGISVTDETLERAARVKRLIGRPQEALLCAKAKRQRQMFYLCESEASAANVLSVRKRSVSNKCFICAKAKRQQQQSAQSERKSTPRFAKEKWIP